MKKSHYRCCCRRRKKWWDRVKFVDVHPKWPVHTHQKRVYQTRQMIYVLGSPSINQISSPVMESFEGLFSHKAEYRVIICRRCQFAVNPAQVKGHIQSKHKTISKERCQQIVEYIGRLSDIAYTPDEVIYPNPDSTVISGIPIYENGLRCTAIVDNTVCNYTCREPRVIARHCRQMHGWQNPRSRGRPDNHTDRSCMWEENQTCQQFFKTGAWQKIFPVQVVPSSAQAPIIDRAQQAQAWMDELFTEMDQAQEQARTERTRYEPNPWLEHTGWERHIRVEHRKWVIETTQPTTSESKDGPDERALDRACEGTMVLIRRSFQASRVEIVGRHALHCINRRENGASSNDRPFYAKQQVKTIRKYAAVFVKILRYIWRTEQTTDRPRYRLTATQEQALIQLRFAAHQYKQDAQQKEAIIQASLAFWVAMFDHALKDDEYESGLLSGLAVLGASGERGGWVPAMYYTPTLAAVITTMRAIVVRRAWRQRVDYIDQQVAQGISPQMAEREAPVIHQLVQQDVVRFMTMPEFGGQPTPIHTIYTQKMYGLKIRYSTHADGQVGWTGDEHDVIVVRKVQFSMGQVRAVVHGLVDTLRRRLVEDLLFLRPGVGSWQPEDLPRFDIRQIVDNQGVIDEGYSFLSDARNQWPVDGKRWMGGRLLAEPAMQKRFVQDPDRMTFQPDAVEAYLRMVKRWKEELLPTAHMCGGGVARGTELVSIQSVNGENARCHRGIMIDQGMVVFTTSYHKGFSASQSQKCIHRFMPQEVGELVVYFLWLVEPFVRILQSSRGQMTSSPWLWEPASEGEWGDEEEEWVEEEEEEEEGLPAMPEDRSKEAAQVQRQSASTVARNCDGVWETNRIRRVMRRECEKRIGVAIGPSDWRQAYPAIHRQFAINRDVVGTLDRIYANENPAKHGMDEEQTREAIRAQQSSHSPQMEESIYGRQLQQNPFATMREQDAFREVSVDWHRFLQFPSSYHVRSVGPDVQRRIKQEQDDRTFVRWRRMQEIDVPAELKKMYGPDAAFRGKQREALDAIVHGQPRMIVVMRTGGGKSLLFMLPAAASPDGVTIVVMPKVMLQEDMARRCQKEGIRSAIWSESRAPPYDAQIVFVIAESAVSQSFADFINAKVLNRQLERVIIDECHSIFQSTAQFRPKMAQLRELIGRAVPIVCLTATLPPRREEAFMAMMDMDPGAVQVIRESTVRPNIAYRVVAYDGAQEMETVRHMVASKLAQYPAEDRIIVYCRTIAQMKHFAETIGGQTFYSQVGDMAQKREIIAMLTQGSERVFWSTSALGEGIDAHTVRVIIHVGGIERLDEFAQQSGRCGRDGVTASESIVLRRFDIDPPTGRSRWRDGVCEREMAEYVQGDRCRRAVLDGEMDGDHGRRSCQAGEQFCDVCRGQGKKRIRVVIEDGGQVKGEDCTPPPKRVAAEQRGQELDQIRAAAMAEQAREAVRQEQRQEAERRAHERFRQQERALQAIPARQQARQMEHAGLMEHLTRLFDRWRQGCSICRIDGRPPGWNGWRLCRCCETTRAQEIDQRREWLGRVQWASAWVACQRCWAPRAICHAWQSAEGKRFRWQPDGKCQYMGTLRESVAVMMQRFGGLCTDWIEEQAGAEGESAIIEWLGSPVERDGIEMSGMAWFFHEWGQHDEEDGESRFGGEHAAVRKSEEESEEPIAEREGDEPRRVDPEVIPPSRGLEQEQQAAEWMWQGPDGLRPSMPFSIEAMDQALQGWHGRCSICHIRGRESQHASWRQCPDDAVQTATAQARASISQIQFSKHTGCFWCQAPQAICHQWENIGHGGPMRFRKRAGQKCQFPGVVADAVAAMLVIGKEQVVPWIEEQAREVGMTGEEGQEDSKVCKAWLGSKVVIGRIEMSGLFRVFWEFGGRGGG